MNKINYSVIMSIYSGVKPEFIEQSIQSILEQTYKTNEFILIKDGPLSREQEVVIEKIIRNNEKRFKCYSFANNVGSGNAYNKGLKLCTNEWAAIMDSDDIADRTKFEKQINFIKTHKDIDVLGTNAIEFKDSIDNVISIRTMPENDREIKKFSRSRCPIIQPTAIFRVSAVMAAGGYLHSPLTEDYDLYIRMIMNGSSFHTIQEKLYSIRTSDDYFRRRGGVKYAKKIISFKNRHYKNGFYTRKDFLKTAGASLLVSIIPNKCRTIIYKAFLRG